MADSIGNKQPKQLTRRGSSGSRMKSTCEPCARAKVKCSGPNQTPCDRCTQRGLKCEFKMEKKRGRRFGDSQSSSKKACSATQCWGEVVLSDGNTASQKPEWLQASASTPLDPHLKRVFQMFFVIYKHHAGPARCCREWFSFHMNKMCFVLMQKGAATIASRLMSWMGKHNIKVVPRDDAYYTKVPEQVMDEETGQKLPPVLTAKGPQFRGVGDTDNAAFDDTSMPRVSSSMSKFTKAFTVPEQKLVSEMSQGVLLKIKASHEKVEIETNQKFEQLFGYTGEQLTKETMKLIGGFLPWGGDVLGFLLVRDADLLAVLRILAIQFSQLGRPPSLPAHRKISSLHNLEVYRSDGQIVDCQMKCLHHESLAPRRVKLEIFIGFQPNGPIRSDPHTFNPFLPPQSQDSIPHMPEMAARMQRLPPQIHQHQNMPLQQQYNPVPQLHQLDSNFDPLLLYGNNQGPDSMQSHAHNGSNDAGNSIVFQEGGTYVPNGIDSIDGKSFVRGNQSLSSMDEDWLDGLLTWTDGIDEPL